MVTKEKIEIAVNESISNTDLFLVDISVQPGNRIMIFLDKKSGGISLDECGRVSRMVEASLNRDEEDFEMEVSSPGLRHPFKVIEQYHKSVGQLIDVKRNNGTRVEGSLLEVNENGIVLEETSRVRMEGHRKKEKRVEQHVIPFSDIKETRIVLTFNYNKFKHP